LVSLFGIHEFFLVYPNLLAEIRNHYCRITKFLIVILSKRSAAKNPPQRITLLLIVHRWEMVFTIILVPK